MTHLLAAIDIGSNAIRMAVCAVNTRGQLEELESHREPVRLGGEVFSQGLISDQTASRMEDAFFRFRTVLERHPGCRVRAVATSAMREARNGNDVARRIERATGIPIEIISGEEEAKLVQVAVADRVKLSGKLALLIDIGGGSVEISVVSDGDIIISDSLKMGAVRLLNLLESGKHREKTFARLVESYAEGIQRQLKQELNRKRPDIAIGTGGNVEALRDLRVSFLGKKDDDEITLKEIEQILDEVRQLDTEERVKRLGLRPDRADVILPALVLLRLILKHAGADKLQIPKVGLKEGVMLDMIPDVKIHSPENVRKQVVAFATEIGRKYQFDEPHGKTVAKFAVQLFEDTRKLHRLDDQWALPLEVSGLLHDIGQFVQFSDHHKHSYYLLRNTPFVGVTAVQKEVLALVARYHRKSGPKRDHEGYAELDSAHRDIVRKLSALLRIADGLDQSHRGKIRKFETALKDQTVTLTLSNGDGHPLESWAVQRKSDLFQESFGVRLVLKDAGT
jgi:exopolyphosphatase/guanosine-5'-triphosphate,3'-diphosphate pyrophosphatase